MVGLLCRWVCFCLAGGKIEGIQPSVGDWTFTSLRSCYGMSLGLHCCFLSQLLLLFWLFKNLFILFTFAFLICKSSLCGDRLEVEIQESFFTGSRDDYPGTWFWSTYTVTGWDRYLSGEWPWGGRGSLWKNSQGPGHLGPVDKAEARPLPGLSKLQIQYMVKTPSLSAKEGLFPKN